MALEIPSTSGWYPQSSAMWVDNVHPRGRGNGEYTATDAKCLSTAFDKQNGIVCKARRTAQCAEQICGQPLKKGACPYEAQSLGSGHTPRSGPKGGYLTGILANTPGIPGVDAEMNGEHTQCETENSGYQTTAFAEPVPSPPQGFPEPVPVPEALVCPLGSACNTKTFMAMFFLKMCEYRLKKGWGEWTSTCTSDKQRKRARCASIEERMECLRQDARVEYGEHEPFCQTEKPRCVRGGTVKPYRDTKTSAAPCKILGELRKQAFDEQNRLALEAEMWQDRQKAAWASDTHCLSCQELSKRRQLEDGEMSGKKWYDDKVPDSYKDGSSQPWRKEVPVVLYESLKKKGPVKGAWADVNKESTVVCDSCVGEVKNPLLANFGFEMSTPLKALQGQWGPVGCHRSCKTCIAGDPRPTACTSCPSRPPKQQTAEGTWAACPKGQPCYHTILDPRRNAGLCTEQHCPFCKPRACCGEHHQNLIVDPDAMAGVCVRHTDDCTPYCKKSIVSNKRVCSKGCNNLVSVSEDGTETRGFAVCQADKLIECPAGKPYMGRFDPDVRLFPYWNHTAERTSCVAQKKVQCKARCKGLNGYEFTQLNQVGPTCLHNMLLHPKCFSKGLKDGVSQHKSECTDVLDRCMKGCLTLEAIQRAALVVLDGWPKRSVEKQYSKREPQTGGQQSEYGCRLDCSGPSSTTDDQLSLCEPVALSF